jgi:hypothetical protein
LIKKSSLVEFRLVIHATKMRRRKYPATMVRIQRGEIPTDDMVGKIRPSSGNQ